MIGLVLKTGNLYTKYKNKFIIFGIITAIVCSLGGYIWYLRDSNEKLSNEKTRLGENFNAAMLQVDSFRTKNGDLIYSVNSLTLKASEYETYFPEMKKQLDDMGIKLKNTQGVTNINYHYTYNVDTTKIKKINDSTFTSSYEDSWLKLSQRIKLINNKSGVKVDSLKINLTDSLLIANEIKYKGWWLWKKPVNVILKMKSSNPYLHIDKIQNINLIK